MRFIIPIILLIISIASFVMFTNPSYQRIKTLNAQNAQLTDALSNSRKLQEERDALNQKYSTISPDSLDRLNKMLPDTADNIRLIIDIQHIAQNYGLSLSAIKYNPVQTATAPTDAGVITTGSPSQLASASNSYGTFGLEFSVSSNYDTFLKFLKDLESSLRLVDVQSIQFSTDPSSLGQNQGRTLFTVRLNTYWLKS